MSIWENYFPTWKQKNYSEHKGTKVEDFNLEQKNRFNRNKGNRQFLKKICNYLKIFYIPFSTLQNYPTQQLKFKIIGPESLERLIERHADASKEESVIDADGARKIVVRTKL